MDDRSDSAVLQAQFDDPIQYLVRLGSHLCGFLMNF